MAFFRRRMSASPLASETEDEAPGWDAIDAALRGLYGDQQPRHVGYNPPMALSANLQGCSAFRNRGHWHYISYGLSCLYRPDPADDPQTSGWGFELTMRVPDHGESDPPGWPFTMINELAKHVNGNAAPVATGHRIDLRAAVTGHPNVPDAPATGLTVFAVTEDVELAAIDTPNGAVSFLQLVGITSAEKELMLAAGTASVLDDLAARDPMLLTDPDRSPAI